VLLSSTGSRARESTSVYWFRSGGSWAGLVLLGGLGLAFLLVAAVACLRRDYLTAEFAAIFGGLTAVVFPFALLQTMHTRIELEPDRISCYNWRGRNTVSILYAEITSARSELGSRRASTFVVKGTTAQIRVPESIPRYDELIAEIKRRAPSDASDWGLPY